MNDDKEQLLASTSKENVMESKDLMDGNVDLDDVDRLFMHLMAKAALRSAGKIPPAPPAPAPGLTQEDRAALADTPEQVAQLIESRADDEDEEESEEQLAQSSADDSVLMAASPYQCTIQMREDNALLSESTREDLLRRHEACRQETHFAWGFEFVKSEQAIGKGGQGTVYVIECLNKFVGKRALKVFSPELYSSPQAYLDDMLRIRDVVAAAHQNLHDNYIYIDRFEEHDGIFIMVMRLVDGLDLQQLVQRDVVGFLKQSLKLNPRRWEKLNDVVYAIRGEHVALAPGFAVNIIGKCLRGIMALQEMRIVHCDIKLSNIMMDRFGSIRLIDFGSAFQQDAPPPYPTWTPQYAPPEVLEGRPWTSQGDFASLGYVLIELLSGRPDLMWPVKSANTVRELDDATRDALIKAKHDLPRRLHQLLPPGALASGSLMELLRRLIHPDPAARFERAEDAIILTAKFNDELVCGRLAVTWVQEIAHWITDVKNAMPGAKETSHKANS
jgi:hypothetical protein